MAYMHFHDQSASNENQKLLLTLKSRADTKCEYVLTTSRLGQHTEMMPESSVRLFVEGPFNKSLDWGKTPICVLKERFLL